MPERIIHIILAARKATEITEIKTLQEAQVWVNKQDKRRRSPDRPYTGFKLEEPPTQILLRQKVS